MSIGVLISAHGVRVRNGMLLTAVQSAFEQSRVPDQLVVAIDRDGLGAAATKQRALESMTTDFTAVLDSDDWFLPEHLQVLEEAQLESGADLVYSWFETHPKGGDPFPPYFFHAPWDEENPRHTTTTILARTEMMKRVGFSADPNPSASFADDDWRMTQGLIGLGAKVHHVAARTWVYRHHQGPAGNTSGLPTKEL